MAGARQGWRGWACMGGLVALLLGLPGAAADPGSWCDSGQGAPGTGGPQAGVSHEQAFGVLLSADGTKVVVTGRVFAGEPHSRAFVAAYHASSGSLLWKQEHDDENGHARGWGLLQPPGSSKVYVNGWSHNRVFLAAHDLATGDVSGPVLRWNMIPNVQHAMMAATSERIFVTFPAPEPLEQGGEQYADIRTLGIRLGDHAVVWNATYDPLVELGQELASADNPQAIALSPDGALVLVAGMSQDQLQDVSRVVLAYDARTQAPEGTLVALDHQEAGDGEAWDAAVVAADGPSPRLLLAGTVDVAEGNAIEKATYLAAYPADPTGNPWQPTQTSFTGSGGSDHVTGIAYDPGSQVVVVTGSVQLPPAPLPTDARAQFHTLTWPRDFAAGQQPSWTHAHGDPALGESRGMAVGAGATRLVVAGCERGQQDFDLRTLGYPYHKPPGEPHPTPWTGLATGDAGDDAAWYDALDLNATRDVVWMAGWVDTAQQGYDLVVQARNVSDGSLLLDFRGDFSAPPSNPWALAGAAPWLVPGLVAGFALAAIPGRRGSPPGAGP